jgi:predicted membrane protein
MILSHKKTKAFCIALFLTGFALLIFLNSFYPWFLLVIGTVLAFRSFALGKTYEACMNFGIFAALTAAIFFQKYWNIVIPIILVIAAIFEVYKAFVDETDLTPEETIEDKKHEIEEDQK